MTVNKSGIQVNGVDIVELGNELTNYVNQVLSASIAIKGNQSEISLTRFVDILNISIRLEFSVRLGLRITTPNQGSLLQLMREKSQHKRYTLYWGDGSHSQMDCSISLNGSYTSGLKIKNKNILTVKITINSIHYLSANNP